MVPNGAFLNHGWTRINADKKMVRLTRPSAFIRGSPTSESLQSVDIRRILRQHCANFLPVFLTEYHFIRGNCFQLVFLSKLPITTRHVSEGPQHDEPHVERLMLAEKTRAVPKQLLVAPSFSRNGCGWIPPKGQYCSIERSSLANRLRKLPGGNNVQISSPVLWHW